jgi:endonuclease/exonuclease/phosphatase family metal-dependent hydrolase
VAGDFNDTPNSYAYRTLSQGMQDAFWKSGRGLGSTFNGPIPGLRIDHMLVDLYIKVERFEVVEEDISDHFPVMSWVGIPL